MKYIFSLAVLALAFLAPSDGALAQSVAALPVYVAPNAAVDLGAGPMETRAVIGGVTLQAPTGAGVGSTSGSSTTLTLTATPTVPPLVGGPIQGSGITAGTTVAAFNGTTTITLSAAMTVASNTPLTWAVACPATPSSGIAQREADKDLPWYTTAHVCAYGGQQKADVVTFAIGAH